MLNPIIQIGKCSKNESFSSIIIFLKLKLIHTAFLTCTVDDFVFPHPYFLLCLNKVIF